VAVKDLSLFEPARTAEPWPGPAQTEQLTAAAPVPEPAKGPAKPLPEPVLTAEALPEVTRSEKPRRTKHLHRILAGSILAALLLGLFALWTSERAPRTEAVNIPSVQKGSVEKKDMTAVVIAEKGSTLYLLAKKHYGTVNHTVIDLILEANPRITDVHLIRLNQKIEMPLISDESLLVPGPGNTYKVHVVTFPKKPAIRSLDDQPVLKGKATEIISRPVSSRETWYRVLAGPFATKEEGLEAIEALRNRGLVPPLSASRS
jgi:phage tail protein X